jgi:hypothetical protein
MVHALTRNPNVERKTPSLCTGYRRKREGGVYSGRRRRRRRRDRQRGLANDAAVPTKGCGVATSAEMPVEGVCGHERDFA